MKEYTVILFENRALRKLFWPEREEAKIRLEKNT
jgi:hypothetical protein